MVHLGLLATEKVCLIKTKCMGHFKTPKTDLHPPPASMDMIKPLYFPAHRIFPHLCASPARMEPLGFAEQVAAGGSDPMKSCFFS